MNGIWKIIYVSFETLEERFIEGPLNDQEKLELIRWVSRFGRIRSADWKETIFDFYV